MEQTEDQPAQFTGEIRVAARIIDYLSSGLYGLSAESIEQGLLSSQLSSWDAYDDYSKTILKISLNVPVKYMPSWMPSRHGKVKSEFSEAAEKLGFSVFYDNTELRKPIVFRPENKSIVRIFDHSGDAVSARG
jgi:hypothetical protein